MSSKYLNYRELRSSDESEDSDNPYESEVSWHESENDSQASIDLGPDEVEPLSEEEEEVINKALDLVYIEADQEIKKQEKKSRYHTNGARH